MRTQLAQSRIAHYSSLLLFVLFLSLLKIVILGCYNHPLPDYKVENQADRNPEGGVFVRKGQTTKVTLPKLYETEDPVDTSAFRWAKGKSAQGS